MRFNPKTKAIFLIIFFLFLAGIIFVSSNEIRLPNEEISLVQENKIEIGEISIYKYETEGLYVAVFKDGFDFNFTPTNPGTLETQGEKGNISVATNATFFAGTYQHATHAGLLYLKGEKYGPLSDEGQLSHIVSYDPETKRLDFIDAKQFDEKMINTSPKNTFFQTGPMVISNNEIQNAFIDSSINGNGRHTRTFLGQLNSGEMFLIIASKSYKLKDLGKIVMELPPFVNKRMNVVNLDGGPSSAIYVKDHPEFSFNADHDLPLTIFVK